MAKKSQRGAVARKVSVDADLLAELQGQIAAISKSQAVIEFDTSGKILTANDNFLNVVGYRLEEIKGQHHGMFVDRDYRSASPTRSSSTPRMSPRRSTRRARCMRRLPRPRPSSK